MNTILLCKYLMLQHDRLWLIYVQSFVEKKTSWCGLYPGALNSPEIMVHYCLHLNYLFL